MKKVIIVFMSVILALGVFAGCGNDNTDNANSGKVYYLNFKPEQDEAWQRLAEEYTKETGVEVKVLTAAEGTYSQTLTSEIEKTDAPTLFQVSGEVALDTWKDYCLDLTDTKVYNELTSDDFALKQDSKVYGVAYVYEGYGIIVNKELLKKAGYNIEDIKDYNSLKRISEDITNRSKQLGFSAFSSSGLDSSSSWRFSGHLVNIPLFYEFERDKITSQPAKVKGTYLQEFKNVWDLYINNSTVSPNLLSTKTGDDSLAEFTTKKAVFFQNGTWEYDNVKIIGDDNLGFVPIYSGIRDENQGICCGTENYWAVNKMSPEKDQKATLDFLYWIVSSEKGTKALAEQMGFVSPFKNSKDTKNVLSNIMNKYVSEGRYNVSWVFNYTPNIDDWRAAFVTALTAYSAKSGSWDEVKKAFVDGWSKQYEASH